MGGCTSLKKNQDDDDDPFAQVEEMNLDRLRRLRLEYRYVPRSYPLEKDDQQLPPLNYANPDRPPYAIQADLQFAWSSFKSKKTDHHDIPCGLILTAPDQPFNLRSGVDIICVIDVSGSMAEDEKLSLVKSTLNFMIAQLREIDRICIISFNTSATKLMPLVVMNNEGKAFAASVVDYLSPGGGTNIVEGLRYALNVAVNRNMLNYTMDILILSDGVDGQQESSLSRARTCLQEFDQYNMSYSIHTFGYGHEHDSVLLGDIAFVKNGGFYYIEEPEDIRHSFSHCLGEILTAVARDLKVTLVMQPGPIPFTLDKIYSECGTLNFRLSNMSCGTSKEAIFELSFPPCMIELNDTTIKPIKAYVSFIMVQTGEIVNIERELSIEIKNNSSQVELYKGVMLHFYRVKVAEALKNAGAMGQQGDYQDGRDLLDDTTKMLKKCEYHNDPLIKVLLKDIELARPKLKDSGSWFRGGHAHFRHAYHGHWAKRGEKHDLYSNDRQKRLRLQSANYF